MKKFLTPEKIKRDYFKGDLTRDKAAELLISLIERSDNTIIRVDCIKALEKINYRDNKIFETLENYLISDENAILRATAAEYIILNFIEEGMKALNWVIEHDKSPLVLKIFSKFVSKFEEGQYKIIQGGLDFWNNEFSSTLGIVPEESAFFLELEALFAEDKRNYEIDLNCYKDFKTLVDVKGGEPWLVIRDEHVVSLNFNYYKWKFIKDNPSLITSLSKLNDLDFYIRSLRKYNYKYINISIIPESIGSLKYLEKLILRRNGLERIPNSLKKLTRLKELDLSYNNLKIIPQKIQSIKSLKYLNFKHNRINKIPDSLWVYLDSLEKFIS